MDPMQRPVDAGSGFIMMGERLLGQGFFDFRLHRSQGRGSAVDDIIEGSLGKGSAEEVCCHFTNPSRGDHLIEGAVEQRCLEARSVLYDMIDPVGEKSGRSLPTTRTTFAVSLMLGTLQFNGRKIEDLPLLFEEGGHCLEVSPTVPTGRRTVNDRVLRRIGELEPAAGMPLLSPGLPAGLPTQRDGLLLEAVARRGLVTVVRVLIEPILQRFDLGCQGDNLFLQSGRSDLHLGKEGEYRIGYRTVDCLELFARQHTSTYGYANRKIPCPLV